MKFTNPGFIVLLILFAHCQNPAPEIVEGSLPAIMCGAPVSDAEWYKVNQKAPLLPGLNVLQFPISTTDTLVQRYFNQGLVLAYGFNHAEAARSFYYASKLDTSCAMCYWGFAYVLGPNYNAGMEPDHYSRAYKAIQQALKVAEKGSSDKELDLIHALAVRYPREAVDDRSPFDIAYAAAMEKLYRKYPGDADIGALYAEAMMDLHPWDLWEPSGEPKPWTPEIVQTLEHILQISPRHPGAHHFYIHAVEASQTPYRGIPSARLFDEDLVPGSGHLVHMASHIYIRTGDYHLGTLSNIRAVEVDSSYTTLCHAQGVYPLSYYPHNYHFLTATATLEGNSHYAIEGALKMAAYVDKEDMKKPEWSTLQHYFIIPYFVYVKLGKWDDILAMPAVDTALFYPQAVCHYARGMAFLGKRDVPAAQKELAALEISLSDNRLRESTIWGINSTNDLVQIAYRVLKGELLGREDNFSEAIQILNEAVALEDQLNYNEPPDWFFSVRHHLGAVQLEAGRPQDAIAILQEDLKHFPKNGWALHGLKRAYEQLGAQDSAKQMQDLLAEVWASADISLESSCIR